MPMTMSNESAPKPRPRRATSAAQRPVELFCIHSYAGEAGPPCGWRGSADELANGKTNSVRRCPRCGRATLLEIADGDR